MYTFENRRITALRLNDLRTKRELSPAELASDLKSKYGEHIKISKDAILGWETTNPNSPKFKKGFGMRIDTICMLADYFDVPVDYLLGRSDNKEKQALGLSEIAMVNLFHIPYNWSYRSSDNEIVTRIRRERRNGKPGQKVEEYIFTDQFFTNMDKIPRIYPRALNAILEDMPSILSTICAILFADKGLSRRDPVDHIAIDGFEFFPAAPDGNPSINSHLDDLCDSLLGLRQMLQEQDNGKEK